MRNFRLLSNLLTVVLILIATASGFTACRHTVGPTSVSVQDSIRHYYPIIQKEELRLSYQLTNTGSEPLVVTEILPSSSAIKLVSDMPNVILPGKTEVLNFLYDSEKNVGYAQHDIRIYGNMLPDGECLLSFDVHIVRPTIERSDYEEIFFDRQSAQKDLVDGKQGEKGYWVGDGTADDDFSRHYEKL